MTGEEQCPVSANVRGHENIEWSIAYAYGLTDGTRDLPRVLLVGDSICRGYEEGVRGILAGRMNVSFWASSYCVTSPAYLPLLSIYLDEAGYDVIHFNNGLHSLSTPGDAYAEGLRAAFALIRRKQPDARLVWCSSTPVNNAKKNAKVISLNAIAAREAAALGLATDDLYAFLDPLDRKENWSDEFHHQKAAREATAHKVADAVMDVMESRD